jgi:CubicO group peptidase (beta-lactamase class C family)
VPGPGSTALSETVASTLTPRTTISAGAEIGLAWHHALRGGQRVIWHNRMTGGFSAMVAVHPSRRTAVAVLANVGGRVPSPLDAIVLEALYQA